MSNKNKIKVAVGMSGGVDSSVAAYLLKEEGYDVFGIFMKNWDEEHDEYCSAEQDYLDVVKVCEKLDIPYFSINFSEQYKKQVFDHFLNELQSNRTPNPDILCNREIKFKVLLDYAEKMGAEFLATGHYAGTDLVDGKVKLIKPKDENKDQTYFLYAIAPDVLNKVIFPLANFTKPEIRTMAEKMGLSTAQKKDSTGICFIGERPFKEFLKNYIQEQKGEFRDSHGKFLGIHDGLCFYTLGQRKGLGVGGPGEPWFVAHKNPETKVITLVQGENHPLLYKKFLTAKEVTWLGAPPVLPLNCFAKIRYRQKEVACSVTLRNHEELLVNFKDPQRAITPGQSVVFYLGEICLGGAIIQEALDSLEP